jgi:hypothetical protein
MGESSRRRYTWVGSSSCSGEARLFQVGAGQIRHASHSVAIHGRLCYIEWHCSIMTSSEGYRSRLLQVSALMWLHTTLNYQYKHGTTFVSSLTTLWNSGGVPRLYRGFGYALILSPATRFLDTAANSGSVALLDDLPSTSSLPLAVKTAAGTSIAALSRLLLLPLDVLKTVQQVEGANARGLLQRKIRKGGVRVFFHGAAASTGSTVVSHFPWFYTVLPPSHCRTKSFQIFTFARD